MAAWSFTCLIASPKEGFSTSLPRGSAAVDFVFAYGWPLAMVIIGLLPILGVFGSGDRKGAAAAIPGVRITPFGHIGDGNIHFNLVQPEGGDRESFLARTHDIEVAIHDIAIALDGSFSAEHGIGQLKRGELARYKSVEAQDQMRRIKQAFDPKGIMNPGKVL